MVAWQLIAYCVAAAGGYLLALSFLLDFIARRLKLTASLPPELVEPGDFVLTLANFIMELLFFVAIPTLSYSFFFFVIPLSGVRAGLAAALLGFGVGAVPTVITLALRIKLPAPYILYILLSVLLKLGGCLAIIGYLYSL